MSPYASTTYVFPTFQLVANAKDQSVFTFFRDGTSSGGTIVAGDVEHAAHLGITPFEHRLAHELGHHLVQRARGHTLDDACRIIHRSAHEQDQVHPEADLDEWVITAATYAAYHKASRSQSDWGALMDLHRDAEDVDHVLAQFRWLLAGFGLVPLINVP